MKKTPLVIDMKQGDQSNYIITVTVTADQKKDYRNTVMTEYQKDATKPGFRKGHVPLAMVEEMVNPGSVVMAVLEEVMNDSLKYVVESHPDHKWIGQAYNMNTNDYKDDTQSGTISFTLDVFPEVVEKNKDWKKEKPKAYNVEVTKDEINTTVDQLRSNYAQFDDVDVVDADSLMRIKMTHQDKKGDALGNSKNQYLGQEELSAHPTLQKLYIGKKKGDVVELPYKKASEIALLVYKGEEEVHTISTEIIEIKKKILPELNQEFIDKTFGQDEEITSVDILMSKIKETLQSNKEQNTLFEWVDTYLKSIDKSFALNLPQTFIDEEVKHRLEHLGKQLGGEKGLKAYLERMGEKESQAYLETIKQAAITSVHKYFVLKFVCDELKLDIDRTQGHAEGEIEKKLYEALVK